MVGQPCSMDSTNLTYKVKIKEGTEFGKHGKESVDLEEIGKQGEHHKNTLHKFLKELIEIRDCYDTYVCSNM